MLSEFYARNIYFECCEWITIKALLQKNPGFATNIVLSLAQHTSKKHTQYPFICEVPET